MIECIQRNYLGFSDGDAESFSNAFLTLVALSGIAGAIYSDIYAGAFKVQWQASIVWTVGAVMLFFLTLNDFSQGIKLVVAAIAWALLAFGLGSMMPSQAAFVGQQLAGPDPVKSACPHRIQSNRHTFPPGSPPTTPFTIPRPTLATLRARPLCPLFECTPAFTSYSAL
jgi:hypothetical protein